MDFYQNIVNLLKSNNITQNQMIQDLNLARNTMYNWNHRKNIPNGTVLLKLSDYFNVSVDFLLGNKKCQNLVKKNKIYNSLSLKFNIDKSEQEFDELVEKLLTEYFENVSR